jgi:hypothetical protein
MKRTTLIGTAATLLICSSLGATVAATASPSAARDHTLSFTAHPMASKSSGHLLIEADRLVRSGATIGYSANTCAFDFATHSARCTVTLARPNGQLRAKATVDADTNTLTGKVTGGTGAYRGATGTVTGNPGSKPGTTAITVHWHS